MIKKEIRVLGLACTTPHPMRARPIQVVGVVYRGNRWLEGVLRITVPPKAADMTARISKMVICSPHFPQLRVIALDELITKSGSYIDIEDLSKMTRLPVISVLGRKIDGGRWRKTATRPSQRAIKKFARLRSMNWRSAGKAFVVYSAGLGKIDLGELLEVCASSEGRPEAVRVARAVSASLGRFLMGRAS